MSTIVTISGSPTAGSRSSFLARLAGERLAARGFTTSHIDVRALPATALLHADVEAPGLKEAIALVSSSRAIVVATPVYKAAYTGVLKTFLDVLPYLGLEGKPALPIVTARLPNHELALDGTLKPVLAALAASLVPRGIFATDEELTKGVDGSFALVPAFASRFDAELDAFARIVPG